MVGAPFNADGTPGTMLSAAQAFAAELERRFAIPVRQVDERWSSHRSQRGACEIPGREGIRRRRVRKEDIDSAAAAVILERWFVDNSRLMNPVEQLREDGSLRHLLTLESLPKALVESLIERAQGFVQEGGERSRVSAALKGVTVANLFTEPSTRTRVSFELAAKRLGAEVVNLEVQLSSRVKGESMLDTVFTLEALNVDVLVIREAEAGVLELVAGERRTARERALGRRGASVPSHPGLAGCADRQAAQGRIRQAQPCDRR